MIRRFIAVLLVSALLLTPSLSAATDYKITNPGGPASPVAFTFYNGSLWQKIWEIPANAAQFTLFKPIVAPGMTVGDLTITGTCNGCFAEGTNAVASVFGRLGAIEATEGDYSASQITATPFTGIAGTDVQTQLQQVKAAIPTTFVTSFATRTGVLTPQQSDYDAYFTTVSEAAAAAPVQTVAGKSGSVTLDEGDIANLSTDLAGKASATHTHAESDITNLTTDLSAKAPVATTVTTNTIQTITGAKTFSGITLSGAAAGFVKSSSAGVFSSGSIAESDVTNLTTDLSNKQNASNAMTTDTNQTVSGVKTHSKQYASTLYTATSTIDWNNGNVQTLPLSAATTVTFANPISGGRYVLILKQDATGNRTVTWPAAVKWSASTVPTLSGANKVDVVSFVYDGTSYYGGANVNF